MNTETYNIFKNCIETKHYNLLKLLVIIYNNSLHDNIIFKKISNLLEKNELNLLDNIFKDTIKVLLCCNWCSSKELCSLWNKMSEGNYIWKNIEIVWEEPCDYYCVINSPPPNLNIDLTKTILFRMEPNMENYPEKWGTWSNPDVKNFLYYGSHDKHLNNVEWHLSKTYNELSTEEINKNEELNNIISTIVSDKYSDPGHMKRIDFLKFLEKKEIHIDTYGGNRFLWKNYKGSLPYHQKDNGLFPYKYTFNCENTSNKNYATEKLYDGILSECLVFYSGCYNIKDFIDERAFIYLELSNFEKDYEIIKKAIEENWWEKRLPYIKKEKQKILNTMQFFPRIENIINSKK